MGTNYINVPGPAQLGQVDGGAQAIAGQAYGHMADQVPQEQATNSGYDQAAAAAAAPYKNATQDASQAQNASGNSDQQSAIELARQQAMGQGGPSASALQLQSGLNQATAQQTAQGNSGRGAAALSTGGANAQATNANLQNTAYTQGGILKSQDMASGAGMYASLTGQAGTQANSNLAEANQFGQNNAQNSQNYQLGMGNAAVGFGQVQNGQNASDLGWYNQGQQAVSAQDEANQQYQEWLQQDNQQAYSQNKASH